MQKKIQSCLKVALYFPLYYFEFYTLAKLAFVTCHFVGFNIWEIQEGTQKAG